MLFFKKFEIYLFAAVFCLYIGHFVFVGSGQTFSYNLQAMFIFASAIPVFLSIFFIFAKEITFIKFRLYFLLSLFFSWFVAPAVIPSLRFLNDVMYYIFPIHFFQVIVDSGDDSPFYLIGQTIVSGLIFLIVLSYKIYISPIKLKINRQILLYPVLSYLLLIPLIWMFTHFTYVSSNWFYMSYHSKFVSTLIQENKLNHNDYIIFKDSSAFKEYFQNKYATDEQSWSKIRSTFRTYELVKTGKDVGEKISYYSLNNFEDWMDFVFNTRHYGLNNDVFYYYSLFVRKAEADYEKEPLRHFLFFIKEYSDGRIASYVNFDPSFKALNKNYIFNIFYVLFHLVFFVLYFWLYKTHKHLFKKDYK